MSVSNLLFKNDYDLKAASVECEGNIYSSSVNGNSDDTDFRVNVNTDGSENVPNLYLSNHYTNSEGVLSSQPFNIVIGEGNQHNTINAEEDGSGNTIVKLDVSEATIANSLTTNKVIADEIETPKFACPPGATPSIGVITLGGDGSASIPLPTYNPSEETPYIFLTYQGIGNKTLPLSVERIDGPGGEKYHTAWGDANATVSYFYGWVASA